ncbi:MAG: hypothetical protein ACSHXJ_15410 [Marinomonas colpomeniae]
MNRDDDVEIPSLTLDQDEVSERRPNVAETRKRPTPSPKKPAHAPNLVHKKTSLVGVYFLLLVILSVSASAGYWLWQQNIQLREELYGAKGEIQNLDHQLIAADVSANQQGQTLEETLKTHDSEIRKLWAIAYDRNRKAIADNSAAIETLERKNSEMRDTISTQSKRVAIQAEAFNDVEAGYNKLIPTVAAIDDVVKTMSSTQEEQATQLQTAEAKISAYEKNNDIQSLSLSQIQQDLTTLQQKIAAFENKPEAVSSADVVEIEKQLATQQDAINSSDAFRTQVNGEIIRLRKQINQLMLEQQLNE